MSQKAKAAKAPNTFAREIIYLAGVLLLITAIAAGLLGWVNSITEDKIIEINRQKVVAALQAVLPEADFEEIEITSAPASVQAAWMATRQGQPAGMCVQVAPSGFGGPIVTIVGINIDGTISGVQITRQTETAGLGTKTTDSAWLAQFNGLAGPLSVAKNVKSGPNDIVAVTAATVSSTAVTDGVQAALTYAKSVMGVS